MIALLADAWEWYKRAKVVAETMDRLGQKHWDHLPWEGDLGRDEYLKPLSATVIQEAAQSTLNDLGDQCVLLLFSVFEALVRDHVVKSVAEEAQRLTHPALQHAATTMQEAIEHGGFFKVLEPFKLLDADLVEQVNQVRRYRNWVAHRRRGKQPDIIDADAAYTRLRRFLTRFGIRG